MSNTIDHLIYTAPTLEEGMDKIEGLLGTRPEFGGQHPNWGTHNALLSLGNAYLEVIAPDPSLSIPPQGLWLEEQFKKPAHLATWVLRTDSIASLRQLALDNDIAIGKTQEGQRQKADGSWLKWHLTDPYALPYDGALPFLIDWGHSTHPSKTAPKVGDLMGLTFKHPEAEMIKPKLKLFAIDIEVVQASQFSIQAEIKSNSGVVYLS